MTAQDKDSFCQNLSSFGEEHNLNDIVQAQGEQKTDM